MVLTSAAACLTNIEFYVMGGQGVELKLHAFVTLAPCSSERSATGIRTITTQKTVSKVACTDSGNLGLRRRWLEIAIGCVMQTTNKEGH